MRLLLSLLLATIVSGCRCSGDDTRPYTPFALESAVPTVPASASLKPDAGAATQRGFKPTTATVFAKPEAHVSLSGLELVAPEGQLIERALLWEVAGQSPEGALAWLVPASHLQETQRGQLFWLVPGKPARNIAAFPGFIPTSPGCQHTLQLGRSGPQTSTLEVIAVCDQVPLAARLPVHGLLVLAPGRAEPKVFELRLAAPPKGEQVELFSDTRDLDNDGRDDVTLTLTLSTKDSKPAAVEVRWLDRALGPTRDFSQPEEAFAAIGSVEVVRSKGRGSSEQALARVANARRLMHYLCSASGSSSVSDEKGQPVDCGNLQRARDWFAQAEVQAQLARERFGEALFAFEHASWYGAFNSEDKGITPRSETLKALRTAIPSVAARHELLAVHPRDGGPGASYSALAFSSEDALLVQTTGGIQRYREGHLEDASDELDPWPLLPRGPEQETLVGLTFPCEQALVELQGRSRDGTFVTLSQGRWLAPRPGLCAGGAAIKTPELRPVRWTREGLSALVGSAWIGPDSALQAPLLGSPVSANGQHWVAATSLGLFVQHETDSEIFSLAADIEPLHGCVIANHGKTVACTGQSGVHWFEAPR